MNTPSTLERIKKSDRMTKKERIMATMRFEETDRVPVFDILQSVEMIEYFGGEPLKGPEHAAENMVIAGRAIANCFDVYRCVWVPQIPRLEKRDDGFVIRHVEYTSWIEERPFHDAEELKGWVKRTIEDVYDWHPNEQWGPWGKLTFDKGYRDRFNERQRLIGDTVLIHDESAVGLDTAMDIAGLQLFIELYHLEPELVSEWLEALCVHELKRIADTADPELSPVALPYCDLAYKGGLIFSPAFLRKEFFPRLKRICRAWHDHDISCIFHSDGNFMEVMDDFVDAGIDGIQSVEPLAGWDLIDVRRKYPQLVLVGNIDSSQLLPFGTVDQVKAAVKKAIDDVYGSGGYILSSSTELMPSTSRENGIVMNLFGREYSRITPFRPRPIEDIEIRI
jgi:hypothetical protein